MPSSYLFALIAIAIGAAGIIWGIDTEQPVASTHLLEENGYAYNTAIPSSHDALAPCVACHRVETSGPERSAPALVGVFGADIARSTWFGYSPALRRMEGQWSRDALDRYLSDPTGSVPGTFKTLSPIRDAEKRGAIIDALAEL